MDYNKILEKKMQTLVKIKINRTFASLFRKVLLEKFGEVAEWSIAAVLKTVVLRGTRGSNPCLSAFNAEFQQVKN